MPEPAQPPPSPPRPAKPEKACIHCAYDLSDTTIDRNCPECGLSVWTSVEGHRLQNFSTPSLRRLRLGLRVLRIGLIAMIIGATWGLVMREELLTPYFDFTTGTWFMPDPWEAIGWLYAPTLAVYALLVLGAWWTSSPLLYAPNRPGPPDNLVPMPGRRPLRRGAVGIAIAIVLNTAVGVRGLFRDQPLFVLPPTTWDSIEYLGNWFVSVLFTSSVSITLLSGSTLFRRLATGLPSPRLVWVCRWLGWVLAALVVAVFGLGIAAHVGNRAVVLWLISGVWWGVEMAVGFSLFALLAAFAKWVRAELNARQTNPATPSNGPAQTDDEALIASTTEADQ